jgi:hypothetical protein
LLGPEEFLAQSFCDEPSTRAYTGFMRQKTRRYLWYYSSASANQDDLPRIIASVETFAHFSEKSVGRSVLIEDYTQA